MQRSSNSTKKGFIRQSILMLMIALFGFSAESIAQVSCVCAADKKTGKMSCTCTDKNAAKVKETTSTRVVKTAHVAKKADLPCKVAVHKHKAVRHKRVSTAVAAKPAAAMRTSSFAATAPAVPCEPACWGYRKNNIFVTICPGLMFDRQDRLILNSDRSWSGYRGSWRIDTMRRLVPVLVAPQSPNTDGYDEEIAPASGSFPTPESDVKIKSDGDFKIKSDEHKIKSEDFKVKHKDK